MSTRDTEQITGCPECPTPVHCGRLLPVWAVTVWSTWDAWVDRCMRDLNEDKFVVGGGLKKCIKDNVDIEVKDDKILVETSKN
ncbi:hypothetical protein RRG08_066626 [Elysia crispata]|uniref:Uncharacterized protein n=1 Tax=Elysia crispata TaxID=231223 RepID=A0AAE1B9C6_9GAST|nr:hypothetical protein RRG08_066626 [Elysia crispata]